MTKPGISPGGLSGCCCLYATIRSRVIARDGADNQTYARPVAEDLVEVLCLDYPNHIQHLSDDDVVELSLPINELYKFGRANTQAEPIDEQLEEEGIHFVSGASMFIASKITNMPALLTELGVKAPDGLLFGIPNRSLLIYKVPTEFSDLIDIANMMYTFTPESRFDNPGGLISSAVYYWSPNGSIESMIGEFDESMKDAANMGAAATDTTSKSAMVLKPSQEFADKFMML